MEAGLAANKAGNFAEARKAFLAAFEESGTAAAQISAANMAVKLGMEDDAMDEYALVLEARLGTLDRPNHALHRTASLCRWRRSAPT